MKPASQDVRSFRALRQPLALQSPLDLPLHGDLIGLNDWYVRVMMFNQKIDPISPRAQPPLVKGRIVAVVCSPLVLA